MLKLLGDRSLHNFGGICEVTQRSIVLKDGIETLLLQQWFNKARFQIRGK